VYNTKINTLNAFNILVGKGIDYFRNPCIGKMKKKVKLSPSQVVEAHRIVRGRGSHIF
jgi:hypothetical protein